MEVRAVFCREALTEAPAPWAKASVEAIVLMSASAEGKKRAILKSDELGVCVLKGVISFCEQIHEAAKGFQDQNVVLSN